MSPLPSLWIEMNSREKERRMGINIHVRNRRTIEEKLFFST